MAGRLRAALAGRIPGLDLARAVAIAGMIAAHVGDDGSRAPDREGWRWLWVADGRSSALFAVLAGVTISIMARRVTPAGMAPASRAHTVVRIAVRGAMLIALGYVLDRLDTPIDVVLTNLGLMFILVLPALHLPRTAQLALATLAMTAGSTVARAASDGLDGWPVLEKLVSHHYPAASWAGYLLVGMAVGRTPLARGTTAAWLAASGAALTLAGYVEGMVLGSPPPWSRTPGETWASVTPHANTTWELVGNTGWALLVIGACLAVARPSRALAPVLAFGSMSLTVYTAHLVVIWWVGDAMVWQPSNVAFVVLTLALIAAAAAWRAWVGPGPLERGLTLVSNRSAAVLTRPRG